jgi:hypothetical protein
VKADNSPPPNAEVRNGGANLHSSSVFMAWYNANRILLVNKIKFSKINEWWKAYFML